MDRPHDSKSTGERFFYNRILSRLQERSNRLGKLHMREACRVLSLACPFSRQESEELLLQLQKLGLVQISGRYLYVRKVKIC